MRDDFRDCNKSPEITTCDCFSDLREALIEAKKDETEITLITAASPPAGAPPNITGIVRRVNLGTIELRLTSGPPNRVGVFSICQIIGFVPTAED